MKKLSLIADYINGRAEIEEDSVIEDIKPVHEAGKNDIAFVSDELKFNINKTGANALIVKENSKINYKNLIYVKNPRIAFSQILELFHPHKPVFSEISHKTDIDDSAHVSENVKIGPFTYIGENCEIGCGTEIHSSVSIYPDVKIGRNCLIHSNVTILRDVEIGDNTIIHSGAVIGSDGFGFARDKEGSPVKIRQVGKVKIGSDCEIGANTTIDRATMGITCIRDNVKLDNLVQIGHNCDIGNGTALSALTGISGSVTVGRNVIMGGQTGVADHVKICDGVITAGKTGVTGDINERGIYAGLPPQKISSWRRSQVLLKNIESLRDKINKIQDKLRSMEEK